MLNQLPRPHINGNIFPAIPDANASTQLALQYQLENSQWWSYEVLRDVQFRQLQDLVNHAASTVPYYQQLFSQLQIAIPDQLTPIFFETIPISTRSTVQHAGDLLQSRYIPVDHGVSQLSTTSGSTGRPVKFARTGLTQTLWLAFALREHLWQSRDFSKKLCAIRWFPRGTAEAPAGIHYPTWGPIVAPVFESGPSASLNVVSTLQQQVDWLRKEKPDYLVSFPSNLVALSNYVIANHIKLPPLREIRTIGETVTERSRLLIQNVWQAKLVDVYSCEEAGYLALQCPETGCYHIQSENVFLEIVDEAGRPCQPGKMGRVLITTLHNYATPLIRYDIGDWAELGEKCSCGRGLPVINKIHGRSRNRLVLPSGDNLFPYLGEHGQITEATGVQVHQFQCIQHSTVHIELKLVADRELSVEEQAKVAAIMQKNLGYPYDIRFSFVNDIPRSRTGKFEEFISHIAL